LDRFVQLVTSLTEPCSAFRVAALELSRLFTAAACRDARVDADDDDGAEVAAGEDTVGEDTAGVPGVDLSGKATPMATAAAMATAATARVSLITPGRRRGCRGPPGSSIESGFAWPGPAAGWPSGDGG